MKLRIIIFFALVISSVTIYAQDLIVTNSGEVIKSKNTEITSDSIRYIDYNDASNTIKSMHLYEISGVRYKDGNIFQSKYSRNSVKKTITEATRTNKRGLHVGINNSVGIVTDGYVRTPYYNENDYYYYSPNFGYYTQISANTKFYFNNFFGLKIGGGYAFTNYFVDDYYYGVDGGYDVNYHADYYIHSLCLPLRAFFTPGNKFGFYAEVGFTPRLIFSAYYVETYQNISKSNSFLYSINPVDLALEGVIGLHSTIQDKVIIFAGFAPSIGIISGNVTPTIALKFGVSYHIITTKPKKK